MSLQEYLHNPTFSPYGSRCRPSDNASMHRHSVYQYFPVRSYQRILGYILAIRSLVALPWFQQAVCRLCSHRCIAWRHNPVPSYLHDSKTAPTKTSKADTVCHLFARKFVCAHNVIQDHLYRWLIAPVFVLRAYYVWHWSTTAMGSVRPVRPNYPGSPPRWPSHPVSQYRIVVWSTIELGVGILCACLPTYRPLLRQISALYSSALSYHGLQKPRRMTSSSLPKDSGIKMGSGYNHLDHKPVDKTCSSVAVGGLKFGEQDEAFQSCQLNKIYVESRIEVVWQNWYPRTRTESHVASGNANTNAHFNGHTQLFPFYPEHLEDFDRSQRSCSFLTSLISTKHISILDKKK